jgi:amino acid transporter
MIGYIAIGIIVLVILAGVFALGFSIHKINSQFKASVKYKR